MKQIQIKLNEAVGLEFRRLSNIAGLTQSETLKELIRIYKEFIHFTGDLNI